MKKLIKNSVKRIFGLTNTQLLNEFINRTLRTKQYKDEQENHDKMVNFYSQFINKNDLCFDIGAHFGNRSNVFLSLNAKVVTVEPQKECGDYIKRKYGSRITFLNKAVGAIEEQKTFYMSYLSSTLSSLSTEWINKVKSERFKDVSWDKEVIVEVTTLDRLISDYGIPSFIKIDVEGYELEVLKGLSKPVKALSFEYTMPEHLNRAIECLNILKSADENYKCNYSVEERLVFEIKEWISIDEMIKYIQSDKFISPNAGDIYVKRH